MLVTRFAPAPTGFLHLGHVVNAIYVWGLARAVGGRILLRIEDHDRQRSRADFERAILDDLDWLGFVPDEPSTDAFRAGPCDGRQSDRADRYLRGLSVLREKGLTYACECSRSDIERAGDPETVWGPPSGGPVDELRYPGTCAAKRLVEKSGTGIRLRLDGADEVFDDLRHGTQRQCPSEQCGDLLVLDRHGNWTYQFAVAVDDFEQGVTFVIRGDDLLASTGRQIQLARLLGRAAPPLFLHHPLIMKTPDQKLSKSDGDTGIRALRDRGSRAEEVIGRAAAMAGLVERPAAISAHEIAALPGLQPLVQDVRKRAGSA